jgi:hypothetical protein
MSACSKSSGQRRQCPRKTRAHEGGCIELVLLIGRYGSNRVLAAHQTAKLSREDASRARIHNDSQSCNKPSTPAPDHQVGSYVLHNLHMHAGSRFGIQSAVTNSRKSTMYEVPRSQKNRSFMVCRSGFALWNV